MLVFFLSQRLELIVTTCLQLEIDGWFPDLSGNIWLVRQVQADGGVQSCLIYINEETTWSISLALTEIKLVLMAVLSRFY